MHWENIKRDLLDNIYQVLKKDGKTKTWLNSMVFGEDDKGRPKNNLWRSDQHEINFSIILEVSNILNRSVDELIKGSKSVEIKSPVSLEIEVLTKVIKGVEEYLEKARKELEPDIKARLVSLLYERFANTGVEPDQKTVVSYLKLVA